MVTRMVYYREIEHRAVADALGQISLDGPGTLLFGISSRFGDCLSKRTYRSHTIHDWYLTAHDWSRFGQNVGNFWWGAVSGSRFNCTGHQCSRCSLAAYV